ncbi:MAG: diadenylate cyclase CdaA [candidate division WOR-3 bacterium]|uniref:Diadenylate cyclase n=1 Tax=candidate division WOR-3 bacterium TaxID=2052148 RepID=A0A7V3ZU02_UNCW3
MISFLKFNFFDFIDILLTSILIFYFLRLFKGTKVPQMLLGIIFILLIAFAAYIFDFDSLKWIIQNIKTIGLIAIIIIFQPEIRRALSLFGRTPIIRYFFGERSKDVEGIVDEIVAASFTLRDRGFGALIAIERKLGLKEYIEKGGVYINAEVSAPLIVTIFTPPSPLHDGAIIIKGKEIVAAGCILPLSESSEIDPALGLRHRAGIGITEVTDAICIIVSEEKREVSLAINGKLYKNMDKRNLKANLSSLLIS